MTGAHGGGDGRRSPEFDTQVGRDVAEELAALRAAASQAVADLQAQVSDLSTRLLWLEQSGAAAGLALEGDPGTSDAGRALLSPQGWAQSATRQEWVDLAMWVDWMLETYRPPFGTEPSPCWAAHPGVVEELAALRGAWAGAARSVRTDPGSSAMSDWHARTLGPTLARMHPEFGSCGREHTGSRPPRRTDRAIVRDIALAAGAE